MPIFKFTISDAELAAYRNAANLGLFPTAGNWARETLREAAREALASVKPEAAPKLTAKQRNEIARFEETLGNLQERIASDTDDLSSIGQWLARRRRDAGQTARDRAYTDAFEQWCVERGLITKGE